MNVQDFKRIARILKEVYKEINAEALDSGLSLTSDEYMETIDSVRAMVLEKHGFTLEEYREAKENYLESVKKNPEEVHIPTLEEIREIAQEEIVKVLEASEANEQKDEPVEKIIEKIVVEKPTIVKETVRVEYDDNKIRESIERVMQKLNSIKVPVPIDVDKLKEDMRKDFGKMFKHNIDILGMPDFRKLAMGLQAQIDSIEVGSSSLSVQDGSTTVNNTSVILFDGADVDVTDEGGGVARVTISSSGAATTPGSYTKITIGDHGNILTAVQALTADINDSLDRRYVTDAQLTVISNTSGTNSGNVTLANIGSSANAQGASLSGQQLTLQPASQSFGGVVTAGDTTTQVFSGTKSVVSSSVDQATKVGLNSTINVNNTAHIADTTIVGGLGEVVKNDNFNQTGDADLVGLLGIVTHAGTGTLSANGNTIGVTGQVSNFTTGTIAIGVGLAASIENQSTGTITEAAGSIATVANTGGGTITTAYGYRVTALAGTTKYGFHCDISGSVNVFHETRIMAENAVRFYDNDSSNYVALKAPATVASNKTITFPDATGTVALTSDLSGYVNAVGTIGASPNAQGASISGNTLTLQPASSSFGGIITTGSQNIKGTKTFTNTFANTTGLGTNMSMTVTNTSDSTGLQHLALGIFSTITDNFNHTDETYVGVFIGTEQAGDGDITGNFSSMFATATNSGTGTVELASGFGGGVSNTSTGEISAAVGCLVNVENSGGGTIGTAAGVFVAALEGTVKLALVCEVPDSTTITPQFAGGQNDSDSVTITSTIGATKGSIKIGTDATESIGFWGTAPVVQPTTAGAAATFAGNTSGTLNDSATFDGYTIGQVVKALRLIGVLA
jgi:hypothetical protein